MIDLVQCQKDLTAVLAGSDQLRNVQVFSYREERIKSEVDFRTKLTQAREGRAGALVMVAMPQGRGIAPNVTGPVIQWEFPVVAIELPAVNEDPILGTLVSAEELVQRAMDVLQLEADEKTGTFRIANNAVKDEQEFVFPGCLAYRATFVLDAGKSQQTARCGPVAVTVDSAMVTTPTAVAGTCTLTCVTAGARVKYTLDGSYPAEDPANNPASTLYTAPFTLSSGDVLRAAAYRADLNKGATRYVEII